MYLQWKSIKLSIIEGYYQEPIDGKFPDATASISEKLKDDDDDDVSEEETDDDDYLTEDVIILCDNLY